MSTVFDQMLERYGNLPNEKLWNAKEELNIWSNDYFLQLADMIKFVP